LDPRPPECKVNNDAVWENFGVWLLKTHKRKNAIDLLHYAKKYSVISENPSFAYELQTLSKEMRRTVMLFLSSVKFLF
jgi:hypothetical protein